MVPKSIDHLSIFASLSFLFIFYIVVQQQNWWYFDYEFRSSNEKYRKNTSVIGTEINDENGTMECKLPNLDPWHPDIVPFLDPNAFAPFGDCKPSLPRITRLRDGRVELTDQWRVRKPLCQFRCLTLHSEHELNPGQWQQIKRSEPAECDVVETRCKKPKSKINDIVSGGEDDDLWVHDLHTQLFESPLRNSSTISTHLTSREAPPPDVHVIILDSVSHPHMLRAMPKTVAFLKDQMGAVPFPFLNRVGLNSRPNGYAMFFGIQVTPVASSVFGSGYSPERDKQTMSDTFLDDEPFVGFEFRAKNYRTMMAEATDDSTFVMWPTGKGFRHPPTDHYLLPLYLALFHSPEFRQRFWHKRCKMPFNFLLDSLQQLLDTRQQNGSNRARFSISWINEEIHDNMNEVYRLDQPISEFFRKNGEKLDNAFVFVMADHGQRMGKVATTAQGQLENNNPALFMVVPQKLRADLQLMQALQENSARLLTHFDVHAALLDIARHGNDVGRRPFSTRFGQSILHPFNKTLARNCDSLKIPLEFCNCQMQRKDITEKEAGEKLGAKIGKAMVQKINAELKMAKIATKCAKLEMKEEGLEVIEVEAARREKVYQVTIRTKPGNGHFWTFVKVQGGDPWESPEMTFLNDPFERMDKYGEQARCALESPAALYCYCV